MSDAHPSTMSVAITAVGLAGSEETLTMDGGATVRDLRRRLGAVPGDFPARVHVVLGDSALSDDATLGELAGPGRQLRVSFAKQPRKEHATVHRVRIDNPDHDMTVQQIQSAVEGVYPELMKRAEHGDLVENVAESGYRMDGVRIVYKRGSECRLEDMDPDVEEYGGIPAWVDVITELPLNYWDLEKMIVRAYGSVATEEGGEEIGFNFHTAEDHAPIGLHEDTFKHAKNVASKMGEEGPFLQFELDGRVFRIEQARTLEDVEGVIVGSEEPCTGHVFE